MDITGRNIEAYLLGLLPPGQNEAFEKMLSEDPALAETVEIYRTGLLDDYSNGRLDQEYKQAFDRQLHRDPLLQEELELHQAVVGSLRVGQDETNFRDALQKMISDANEEKPKIGAVRRMMPVVRWSAAIAAGLALIVAAWHFLLPVEFDTGYDFQYKSQSADASERNRDLLRFEQLFNDHQYNEAYPYIEKYVDEEPRFRLYAGITLMRMTPPELGKAKASFEILDTNMVYKYDARWFIALTYEKQGNWDSCAVVASSLPQEFIDRKKGELKISELIRTAEKKASK